MMQSMTDNLRWRDPQGRIHAVEGSEVLHGIMLHWTRCGLFDVPAGGGWEGNDSLTCAACRIWIDLDPSLDATPA